MTFEAVGMRRSVFEGGATPERIRQAEMRLDRAFRHAMTHRADQQQAAREVIAAQCQETHEKILGYGLVPSVLAFIAAGIGRERAQDVISGVSEAGFFSSITSENADAVLSASNTGMAAAACAVMAVLLSAAVNQFRGEQAERRVTSGNGR